MPEFYGWVIGAWGALLLGAAVGTTLALRLRHPFSAALLALILTLSFTLALLAVVPFLPLDGLSGALRFVGAVVVALVPYALAMGVICLRPGNYC
jgi:predicted permease